MDWKTLVGAGVDIGVNVAVSRFAPGIGGSLLGGTVGGVAGSVTESVLNGEGVDVEDAGKSAVYGGIGSLVGHGVGGTIGAASRWGAKKAGSELGRAATLSSDASTAAKEWKDADSALTTARDDLSKINKNIHPFKYSKAQKAVTQAEGKAAKSQSEWENAQIKADNPGFSVSKMKSRKQTLEAMGKHLRGGKGRASNKKDFREGGWGNTGLRSLGSAIGAGMADGRSPAQKSPAGGGKQGGKDGPDAQGPGGQKIQVSWGGEKYMKGESKEPFAPDPKYTTEGDATGFLLYPVGVNQQIRNWYVG